jgi:hypothetical protein
MLLQLAVKATNDTQGFNGLVPSMLVCGTRFPILQSDRPNQCDRLDAIKTVQAEMNNIIAEQRSMVWTSVSTSKVTVCIWNGKLQEFSLNQVKPIVTPTNSTIDSHSNDQSILHTTLTDLVSEEHKLNIPEFGVYMLEPVSSSDPRAPRSSSLPPN